MGSDFGGFDEFMMMNSQRCSVCYVQYYVYLWVQAIDIVLVIYLAVYLFFVSKSPFSLTLNQ